MSYASSASSARCSPSPQSNYGKRTVETSRHRSSGAQQQQQQQQRATCSYRRCDKSSEGFDVSRRYHIEGTADDEGEEEELCSAHHRGAAELVLLQQQQHQLLQQQQQHHRQHQHHQQQDGRRRRPGVTSRDETNTRFGQELADTAAAARRDLDEFESSRKLPQQQQQRGSNNGPAAAVAMRRENHRGDNNGKQKQQHIAGKSNAAAAVRSSGRRPKMERGISKATENEFIVHAARSEVESRFGSGRLTSSPEEDETDCSAAAVSGDHRSIGSPPPPTATTTAYTGERSVSSSSGYSSYGSSNGSSGKRHARTGSHGSGVVVANSSGFIETPLYTFTLPDLSVYPDDFRGFLERDLIELSSLVSLEDSGRLNWWAEAGAMQRLWPLATTGDGNCLLHAASLGMWGFHDRLLTLRKALHAFLTSSECAAPIYRRWRWQSHLQNLQYGLTLSEREWADEWRSVLRLASSEPRHSGAATAASNSRSGSGSGASSSASTASSSSSPSSATADEEPGSPTTATAPNGRRWSRLSLAFGGGAGTPGVDQLPSTMYESLEEVHVLALAHILRRTIIVVADTVLKDINGEALAPIPFGGVYLPLECPPDDCHKSPLLLTYNAGHFSALVSMQCGENSENAYKPAVIPLTDSTHTLLPLHFSTDPGADFAWNRDEFDTGVVSELQLHPNAQISLLSKYLEIVKVAVPEDYADGSGSAAVDTQSRGRPASARSAANHPQHGNPSVAKQFGSIGKKLKKNLGRLARSGSFREPSASRAARRRQQEQYEQQQHHHHHHHRQQQQQPHKIGRNFILGAFLHTGQSLPYQNEMVQNYLQEARERFDHEQEERERKRAEQVEAEERRKREIYLNGGYLDCKTPGCNGRCTAETDYQCPLCASGSNRAGKETPTASTTSSTSNSSSNGPVYNHGKSKFYVNNMDAESDTETSSRPTTVANAVADVGELPLLVSNLNMTVKLPSSSSLDKDARSSSDSGVIESGVAAAAAAATKPAEGAKPCQYSGCDFYGTAEMHYFCSKCYTKLHPKPERA